MSKQSELLNYLTWSEFSSPISSGTFPHCWVPNLWAEVTGCCLREWRPTTPTAC